MTWNCSRAISNTGPVNRLKTSLPHPRFGFAARGLPPAGAESHIRAAGETAGRSFGGLGAVPAIDVAANHPLPSPASPRKEAGEGTASRGSRRTRGRRLTGRVRAMHAPRTRGAKGFAPFRRRRRFQFCIERLQDFRRLFLQLSEPRLATAVAPLRLRDPPLLGDGAQLLAVGLRFHILNLLS
jgi:hypothetical protein